VHFSRSRRSEEQRPRDVLLLLSGSTDGLVCVSNADEADEDEAVVYVGNLGSSIAQAGWWMPRRDAGRAPRMGAWAATDMETFSLWSDEARTPGVASSLRQKLTYGVFLPSPPPTFVCV
jgi:hypothetical protein